MPRPMTDTPLQGQTVLVTRSAGQSDSFRNLLEQAGAAVLEMPTLEIGPPTSWEALDEALAELETFDWLILTSANGVEACTQRLEHLGRTLPDALKIAVVGRKTAAVLGEFGRQPDFTPTDFVADALAAEFPADPRGLRILFPRVESGGREVLVQQLRDRGAEVVEVAAYESRCPKEIPLETLAALKNNRVSAITFASSKTVRHFGQLAREHFGPDWAAHLSGVAIASIGPQTSEACQDLFGRVDVEAREYTLEGLTEALGVWATRR